MSTKNKFFDFSYFKFDLLGGITAGVVALPLALAFGEQSGLGAASGLYGAAFIGFFAALFGGTATQISGPTAPMTALSMVIIAGIIQACEGDVGRALPMILALFALAGLIQVLSGVFKVGTYIKYIPYPVISGFMTGIGVIIIITQIPAILGYNSGKDQQLIETYKPHGEELILNRMLSEESEKGILVFDDFRKTADRGSIISEEEILAESQNLASNAGKGVVGSLKHIDRALSNINWTELILALITIFIIYGFKRITTAIPSTLVALVLVSSLAYFGSIDYRLIQEIPIGLPNFHLDVFTGIEFKILVPFLLSAFTLAMLGSIDSLLTSLVADNLTKTQHKPNKELIGQGIGNTIAAFFGGLPGAGATIRTVVNINAGGKTRLSGMIAGVFLFCILIVLGPIASMIPAAVLAGILITVGIGVMDYKGLKALHKMETNEKFILLIVLLLTVFWQLVYAVGFGLVLAALVFLKRMGDISESRSKVLDITAFKGETPWLDEKELPEAISRQVYVKHIEGPLFFGMINEFKKMATSLPNTHVVIIRMERVPYIDQSGLYALEDSILDIESRNIVIMLTGIQNQPLARLRAFKIIPTLIPEDYLFDSFKDCAYFLRHNLSVKGADLSNLVEELKSRKNLKDKRI